MAFDACQIPALSAIQNSELYVQYQHYVLSRNPHPSDLELNARARYRRSAPVEPIFPSTSPVSAQLALVDPTQRVGTLQQYSTVGAGEKRTGKIGTFVSHAKHDSSPHGLSWLSVAPSFEPPAQQRRSTPHTLALSARRNSARMHLWARFLQLCTTVLHAKHNSRPPGLS